MKNFEDFLVEATDSIKKKNLTEFLTAVIKKSKSFTWSLTDDDFEEGYGGEENCTFEYAVKKVETSIKGPMIKKGVVSLDGEQIGDSSAIILYFDGKKWAIL